MKKYIVNVIYENGKKTTILATNDRQKAIDEWLWSEHKTELLVFNEQGEHIRTLSQITDLCGTF